MWYIIHGNSDKAFWIYDIPTKNISRGPNLNYARFVPICEVVNNYLYVASGRDIHIEKIDLFNMDGK